MGIFKPFFDLWNTEGEYRAFTRFYLTIGMFWIIVSSLGLFLFFQCLCFPKDFLWLMETLNGN